MPRCSGCQQDKAAEEFYKNAHRSTGVQARCKACDKARQQSADGVAYHRAYNRTHAAEYKAWQQRPESRRRQAEREKGYRTRRDAKDRKNARENRRRWGSVAVRLASNIRSRLKNAIRREWKTGSTLDLLGCSIEQLRVHLESQFRPGMTWANWARDGWHIDHIKPLAAFDLSDRAQLAAACNYTNLRPLWAAENLSKNARPDWRGAEQTEAIANA